MLCAAGCGGQERQAQRVQLVYGHRRWGFGDRAGCLRGLGERDHVPDRACPHEQHGQAVQPQRETWRCIGSSKRGAVTGMKQAHGVVIGMKQAHNVVTGMKQAHNVGHWQAAGPSDSTPET